MDGLLFYSRSRAFRSFGYATIAGYGLQNLGIRSGRYTGCDTGPRFLPRGPPHSGALYETLGVMRTYSDPGPHSFFKFIHSKWGWFD